MKVQDKSGKEEENDREKKYDRKSKRVKGMGELYST